LPLQVGIVGAGFSGLFAAKKFLELGFKVRVFEEHEKVGFPEHCTGIVSGYVVGMIGPEARDSIINSYNDIKICYEESCVKLKVRGGLFKLDRVKLEKLLKRSVEREGGEILFNTKVIDIDPTKGRIFTKRGKYTFDIIILSEGFGGRLRRKINIGLPKNFKPLIGLNFETTKSCNDVLRPKVIFGTRYAKDFFIWEVPIDRGRCLVGGASRDPRGLLELYKSLNVIKAYGGPVITGPPAVTLRRGKVFVLGDAAGLNKPLTGGGLYPNSKVFKILEDFTKNKSSSELNVDIIIQYFYKSLKIIQKELNTSYRIAKSLYKNLNVLKCGIEVLSDLEKDIPPIEYDDLRRTVKELLMVSPGIGMNILMKSLKKCPIELIKMSLDLLK
jgi:flavin-dependent dehydrogenase